MPSRSSSVEGEACPRTGVCCQSHSHAKRVVNTCHVFPYQRGSGSYGALSDRWLWVKLRPCMPNCKAPIYNCVLFNRPHLWTYRMSILELGDIAKIFTPDVSTAHNVLLDDTFPEKARQKTPQMTEKGLASTIYLYIPVYEEVWHPSHPSCTWLIKSNTVWASCFMFNPSVTVNWNCRVKGSAVA